ncbi:ParA family protein [Halobacteriales archaeon Cl-PHB]
MAANATLALVGAVGGAGTSRLAVESGATLARAGHDVAVLDAAFATQGLADYVPGRIDTELTSLLTGGGDLENARYDLEMDRGRLALYPASAPFERLARAKTAGAAEAFESRVGEAALSHDVVIVDTPPVAANQAVAAVSVCDRVAVVAPDTDRGADGLARMQGRIADVGAGIDAVVATFADGDYVLEEAVATIPAVDETAPRDCPTSVDPASDLGPSIAAFLEAVLDVDLDLEFEGPSRLERVFD